MTNRLVQSILFQAATTNDEEEGSGADNDEDDDLEVNFDLNILIEISSFLLFTSI